MHRAALAPLAAIILSMLAPAAFADPEANATTTAAAASSATPTVDSDSATGSINVVPSFDKRMADCMAVWDKGTHMTKDQWRRTCKTTLDGP